LGIWALYYGRHTAIDGTRFAAFPAHDAKQLICQMSALYHPYLSRCLRRNPTGGQKGASVKTHYALRHFWAGAWMAYTLYSYLCEMLSQSAISAVAHFPPELRTDDENIETPPHPNARSPNPNPNPKPNPSP